MSAQPNSRAWVWTNNGNFHLCHDRDLFKTYDAIEPLPLVGLVGGGEILAKGIGSVDLDIQKSNGSKGVLKLTNVLYVPGALVNLIPMSALYADGVSRFAMSSGKATAENGREVAWFPLDTLWCLKLADGDDRLFPCSLREQDRPVLMVSTFAESQPVKKPKMSKYRFIKDGWGSRGNFQYSYGLRSM